MGDIQEFEFIQASKSIIPHYFFFQRYFTFNKFSHDGWRI